MTEAEIEAQYEVRDATALFWLRRGGVNGPLLPVMHDLCSICEVRITEGFQHHGLARINGDSRWGYEMYHLACTVR